jgi:hypothetical protein
LIWRVGCTYRAEFGKTTFIIQPIEKLLIELIKVHFDLLITTEIMGRRFKGGAMTCQSC